MIMGTSGSTARPCRGISTSDDHWPSGGWLMSPTLISRKIPVLGSHVPLKVKRFFLQDLSTGALLWLDISISTRWQQDWR